MTVRILVGDCRARLAEIPNASIQCVMTSVPYWGLRSYGTEPQVWGGDAACAHQWGTMERGKRKDMLPLDQTTSAGRSGTDDRQDVASHNGGNFCEACGAWRGEHGMEPALEMWLAHEVLIWREVRRVLRDDGTVWINIGDSYATKPAGWSAEWYKRKKRDDRTFRDKPFTTVSRAGDTKIPDGQSSNPFGFKEHLRTHDAPNRNAPAIGLASKQRLMLPARLAIALQDDGWWLRDEIVWAKPNPMPSSVEDRTTPAHEMLYLFAKSGRALFWSHRDRGLEARVYKRPSPDFRWRHRKTGQEVLELPAGLDEAGVKLWMRVNLWSGHDYYYDVDAIAEPASPNTHARIAQPTLERQQGGVKAAKYKDDLGLHFGGGIRTHNEILQSVARRSKKPVAGWDTGAGNHDTIEHAAPQNISGNKQRKFGDDVGRPESHIGRSVPWSPGVTPKSAPHDSGIRANDSFQAATSANLLLMRNKRSVWNIATEPFPEAHFATFPTALVEPCIKAGCPQGGVVLDPFGGSGTVGLVADRLGRHAILIELNPEYAAIAERRIRADGPLLAEVAAE